MAEDHDGLVWEAMNGRVEACASLVRSVCQCVLPSRHLSSTRSPLVSQLDSGSSVDETDEDGSTALIAASWAGHVPVIELLLARGAQIDVRNETVSTIDMRILSNSTTIRFTVLVRPPARLDGTHCRRFSRAHRSSAHSHPRWG